MPLNNELATCVKVDDELGLVFGFAIVCKKDGKPYVDVHNDHIPEDSMLKAASEFMTNSRVAADMHQWDDNRNPIKKGSIVFAFPLTTEIAKALDIKTSTTGLLIAMKPSDPRILEKFKTGVYTGFSIGGQYVESEVVDAAVLQE